MTENKRYEFDVMNGGGYVVGYSERMSDDISFFTRLCEVPTKTQAEKVCNELKGLQKENEQLKQQFNYIQNSISEHIKHQKTKLGQKALQEIIEDYNEWLLGHKRL